MLGVLVPALEEVRQGSDYTVNYTVTVIDKRDLES